MKVMVDGKGRIKLFYIILLIFIFQTAKGQDYSPIFWFTGPTQWGITFKKSDFTAQLDSIQNPAFGNGGGAVATNPINGDLMFYADGAVLYDASHQLIQSFASNGWSLLGNLNGNQPAAACAIPGQANQYLIISNSATLISGGTISTTQVDMTAQGNATPFQPSLGNALMPGNTTLTNVSEGMVIIADPGGTGYWLIIHERGTATFTVVPIDNSGLNTSSSQTYNFITNGMPSLYAANISWHASGKIAISPQDTAKNVQILDFSNVTGVLQYDTTVFNSAVSDVNAGINDNYAIYDTEWSNDGTLLYISRYGSDVGNNGMVYIYDLTTPQATIQPVLSDQVYRSYGLQAGPDSLIYHLYQETSTGPILTGRISQDTLGQVVYESRVFGNTDFEGRQFPATLPYERPSFSAFNFVYTGTCYGTPTKFYHTVEPPPTFIQWDLGDGAGSNEIAPIHQYTQAGQYNVSMRATINGIDSVEMQSILIIQSDTVVLNSSSGTELPQDTTICQDEILTLDATATNATSYTWSDPTFSGAVNDVDTAGYYWVVATFPVQGGGECTSYDAINVNEYDYQLQIANQWYFGDHADLDFNETPPVVVGNSSMVAPAGCAAVSDRNGDILFYTNGDFAYGRTGDVIGTNIGGEIGSSQSSIAIPFPGDETMYYIFTTEEVYGATSGTYQLNYGVLDIKETIAGNSDPGEVVFNNLPLFSKNTERLTAIGGYGQDAMLVAHEFGNNTFRFYPITAQGIGNPILYSVGSVHDLGSQESAQGYMKFSGDGSKLAVALSQGGLNYVELFEIDSLQNLSNPLKIEFDPIFSYPQYQTYGVEFSSGGNKLFVTLTGNNSKLIEMRVDTLVLDTIQQSINYNLASGFETGNEFGALQIGPDGQVYMALNNSSSLPYISPNDQINTPSSFNPTGADLAGKTSTLGLPNFVQNMSSAIDGVSASVFGFCVGQPTNFSGQQSSDIDVFRWTVTQLSDTTTVFSSTNLADTYIFEQSGDYGVAFTVSNRCGFDTTLNQVITIQDPPTESTMVDVASICAGDLLLEVYPIPRPQYTYLWSDGSTGRSLSVSTPGIYMVTTSYVDPTLNGCINQDTVFVAEGRPQFDLGPDLTVCENDNIPDFNTGLNPIRRHFDWKINTSTSTEIGPTHPVDTSVPGQFTYTLEVYDSLTTCYNSDTVDVDINPIPSVSYSIKNSTCGDDNGEITILNNPDNATILLQDLTGSQTVQLDSLAPGTYTLIGQDAVNGCASNYSVAISDDNLTITPNPIPDCTNGQIQFDFIPSPGVYDYDLRGIDNPTHVFGDDTTSTLIIENLDPGEYNLEVKAGGCIDVVDSIILIQLPTAVIVINPQYSYCGDDKSPIFPDLTLSTPLPSTNPRYSWQGPTGGSTESAVLSVYSAGTWTVTYPDDSIGMCPSTETFEISRFEYPEIEVVVAGDSCGSAIQLIAQIVDPEPNTNYSYLWSYNNLVGPAITLPAPTGGNIENKYNNISVQVSNQQTGCPGISDPKDYTTYADYTVYLTSDPACDNGLPISILANILNIPASEIDTYTWSGPESGIEDLNSQIIGVDEEGTYTVVTSWNGCEENASLLISRNPVTESGYNDQSFVICPEPPANEVQLMDVTQFITYTLYNITYDQYVDEIEPGIYEIYEEGLYAGEGLNSFGCFTYDTLAIIEDCVPEIYAPTAFSPNATIEKNLTFSIDGVFIGEDFEIKIYNRWGELVYASQDRNFKWDGTSQNGTLLPGGTFAYVIRYRSSTDPEKGILELRGGVTLLR